MTPPSQIDSHDLDVAKNIGALTQFMQTQTLQIEALFAKVNECKEELVRVNSDRAIVDKLTKEIQERIRESNTRFSKITAEIGELQAYQLTVKTELNSARRYAKWMFGGATGIAGGILAVLAWFGLMVLTDHTDIQLVKQALPSSRYPEDKR